jgi:chromosome segregation ATPase
MHHFPERIMILLIISLCACFLCVFPAKAQEGVAAALQDQMDGVTSGLQENVEAVLRENERLSTENNSLTATLRERQERILDVQRQIAQSQEFLQAHQSVLMLAEEEKAARQQLEDLGKREQVLSEEVASLRQELSALQNENQQWQSQADSLKAQKQSLLEYQRKDLQFKVQERMRSLTDQTQAWRKRSEGIMLRQGLLGRKIRSSRQGIALLEKNQSEVIDVKLYHQLLRLLNLNGQRVQPKSKESVLLCDIKKDPSSDKKIEDVLRKTKDLGDFLLDMRERFSLLSEASSEDVAYQDLFAAQVEWVHGQSLDTFSQYQKLAQDIISVQQDVKNNEMRVKSLQAQNQKLDVQLSKLRKRQQDAQAREERARGVFQKIKEQGFIDTQKTVAKELSQEEIEQVQAEIDRCESLKQKVIRSQERRLEGLLGDLNTQNKILLGKISDLQGDILRAQGEKEVLESALGSGVNQETGKEIKSRAAATAGASPAPSQKAAWKTPKILQE